MDDVMLKDDALSIYYFALLHEKSSTTVDASEIPIAGTLEKHQMNELCKIYVLYCKIFNARLVQLCCNL